MIVVAVMEIVVEMGTAAAMVIVVVMTVHAAAERPAVKVCDPLEAPVVIRYRGL